MDSPSTEPLINYDKALLGSNLSDRLSGRKGRGRQLNAALKLLPEKTCHSGEKKR